MIIGDLFNVEYGQRELHSKEHLVAGSTLVISSQGTECGCYGFFSTPTVYSPPFITVPSTGSIGYSFVQEFPCAITDDVLILSPKKKMKMEELFYVAAIIRNERWRFNYGRKITPSRLKKMPIDLSKMDLQKIQKYRNNLIKKARESSQLVNRRLDEMKKYADGEFRLDEIMTIEYGASGPELTSKTKLKPGNTLIVTSQGSDYGCFGFFNYPCLYSPPLISVPRTGSIGYAVVQEYPCTITDDSLVLTAKNGVNLSIEQLYFIASVIRQERWRFNYGRKITPTRLGNLKINFSKMHLISN